MASNAKKILLVGGLTIALMILFPPWDYFDNDSSGRLAAGYHFFLTPPKPRPAKEIFGQARFPHQAEVRVDELRFILQLLFAIPATLGLAVLFKAKRSIISVSLAVLLLGCAVSVLAFVAWMVISIRLEYKYWAFP
jgi:hypothetical protein